MTKPTLRSTIAILFIVSGATGLIYQVVWFKYLSLFLGNTTHAQAVLLATFMGGLAIGATVWGRRADRAKHPLMLYALLELGISVYCLFYPLILGAVKNIFIGFVTARNLPSDSSEVLFLKVLASLSTLLVPTILMGGTLPVLVKFLSERIEESGKTVAKLYFLNSFGAVVGSILGGFFFIRIFGLSATIYLTAAVNLIVGVVALFLGRIEFSRDQTDEQQHEADTRPEFYPEQVTVAVLVAGLSGLAAMIYEVAWVRMLIPVLGSSTYSFTLMLVAFISGITLGSWIVSAIIHRISNMIRFLSICQAGVALSLLATLPLYGRVPYYFWHLAHILTRTDSTYPIFLAVQFVFGFLIMLVPTIFLGMTLPVASRIASRSVAVLGKSIGTVFSVNTLGTVIGSLAAGLLLIPTIGVKHTIEIGLAMNILGSFLTLGVDYQSSSLPKIVYGLTVFVALIASVIGFSGTNQLMMLSAVFRQINKNTEPPPTYQSFVAQHETRNVLYYKEGSSATVAVVEGASLGGLQNILLVNGKADASSKGDLPTQVMLAQIPLIFHPKPQDVFVIGLGSGITVGSLLTHPVRSLDCVEISPEVVDASRFFDDVSHKPLSDSRTHLYIDDALSFLKLSNRTYDVIVSEPSNPWIAGIGSLYTREFFQKCREHLNPGGIMVQWFHLYEMDDQTFRLVLQTLRSSFPNLTVWQSLSLDVILVGSESPLSLDVPALKAKLSMPEVRQELSRIHITQPAQLLSLQIASENQVPEYVGYGETNTEDLPLLEYWAPKAFFVNKGVTEFGKYDERLVGGKGTILLEKYRGQVGISDAEKRLIGLLHTSPDRGNASFGYSLLSEYQRQHPDDAEVVEHLAEAAMVLNKRAEGLVHLKHLVELQRNAPDILERYAMMRFTSDRGVTSAFAPVNSSESRELLQRCIQLVGDTVDRYHVDLADILFEDRNYAEASTHYQRALDIRLGHSSSPAIRQDVLLYKFALSAYRLGDDEKAMVYGVQALQTNRDNEEAKDLVYTLYLKKNPEASLPVH